MMQWQNAMDAPPTWKRILLYGPTGSGKTYSAATAPDPIFLFPRNEGSDETLRGRDIPFMRLTSTEHTSAVLKELLQLSKTGKLNAKTIVFESLTHYSEIVVGELTDGGVSEMHQRKWGAYMAHMMGIRDILWQLNAHVILTGLDFVKTDSEGKNIIKSGLRVSGQSAELIAASCDAVGYCEQLPSNPPVWQVHFKKYKTFDARTRIRGMACSTYKNFNWNQHIEPFLNGNVNIGE